MPEQPTSDATSPSPVTPDAPAASTVPAEPAAPAQPVAPAQPAEAPKTSDSGSKRKKILSALGTVALLLVAKFGLAAVFADDPTHGVAVGQCVAADGSDDFKQVDCGSSDSLGKVTFVAKDAETT